MHNEPNTNLIWYRFKSYHNGNPNHLTEVREPIPGHTESSVLQKIGHEMIQLEEYHLDDPDYELEFFRFFLDGEWTTALEPIEEDPEAPPSMKQVPLGSVKLWW